MKPISRVGKIARHCNHDRAEPRNFAHAAAPRGPAAWATRRYAVSRNLTLTLARCPPYEVARYDSNFGNAVSYQHMNCEHVIGKRAFVSVALWIERVRRGADATFCVARTTTRDAKPDNAGSLAKLRWTSRVALALPSPSSTRISYVSFMYINKSL